MKNNGIEELKEGSPYKGVETLWRKSQREHVIALGAQVERGGMEKRTVDHAELKGQKVHQKCSGKAKVNERARRYKIKEDREGGGNLLRLKKKGKGKAKETVRSERCGKQSEGGNRRARRQKKRRIIIKKGYNRYSL